MGKVNNGTTCTICRIVSGELPSAPVLENSEVIAFMDLRQPQPGHVLVVPRTHYARLGELFSGDLDRMDVIKIHKTSPRLSLFALSDMSEAMPRLKSRVKIDLQTQQVRFFDHSTNAEPELLVGKQLLGFDESGTDDRIAAMGRRILLHDEPFGLIVRERTLRAPA